MEVQYMDMEMSQAERVAKMQHLIRPGKATIFSRMDTYFECIAIVPSQGNRNMYAWVWLSGDDGAYVDTGTKNAGAIASTLVKGQWVHQPDAKMVMTATPTLPDV